MQNIEEIIDEAKGTGTDNTNRRNSSRQDNAKNAVKSQRQIGDHETRQIRMIINQNKR